MALATLLLAYAGGKMGLLSGKRPLASLAIADGQLKPVRTKRQNAVSSLADTDYHRIAPLNAGADPRASFEALRKVVASYPGAAIIEQRDDYIYAEFTTQVLRFVDDVEFRLNEAAKTIDVRSASRLGRQDFGTNRKRIEKIRALLAGESGKRP
ncbi:MAG: DUF1499 domain-containing protein [Quisquiliibacterium sp.]